MISFKSIRTQLFGVLSLILLNLTCVPAPVPRCSFFIIINKLSEYSNILSDANPYFPVPPCEYGGPWQAIRAGDYKSVFILAEPQKIPKHNFYELLWFMRKGGARIGRIWRGEEPFIHDDNILREGYRHYTPYVRTRQIGTGEYRRPEVIDNPRLYDKAIQASLREIRNNNNRNRQRPPEVAHIRPYNRRPKRKIVPHHPENYEPSGTPYDYENFPAVENLEPGFARTYEGGFFPGGRPNTEAPSEAYDQTYYTHPDRSDTPAPVPSPVTGEFRPHQRVLKTKFLDTEADPEGEFGKKISQ